MSYQMETSEYSNLRQFKNLTVKSEIEEAIKNAKIPAKKESPENTEIESPIIIRPYVERVMIVPTSNNISENSWQFDRKYNRKKKKYFLRVKFAETIFTITSNKFTDYQSSKLLDFILAVLPENKVQLSDSLEYMSE